MKIDELMFRIAVFVAFAVFMVFMVGLLIAMVHHILTNPWNWLK